MATSTKPKKLSPEMQRMVDSFKPMGEYMAQEAAKISTSPEWIRGIQQQFENFMKAGLFLQPKQIEFALKCRECDRRDEDAPSSVMFSGGRGSAKSHGGAAQVFADDCQRRPELKVLYLRKIAKANAEQVADLRKSVLHSLPHTYLDTKKRIDFPNGSFVILGNYKDESDLDNYLGQQYDLIMVEESNQLTFSKLKNIMSCLRTSKPDWKPRAYLLTNPGGVGHAQSKKIYFEPWKLKQEKETRFVHSTVLDNSFVNPEYLKYLQSLTGWQRKAWLEGSWEFMQGAYFSNFVEDVHVYPNSKMAFDWHHAKRWMAAYDFGFAHNASCVLGAEDVKGNLFIVDNYCDNEKSLPEVIENIKAMLRKYGLSAEDLDFFAAGKDCFHRDENGKTIANTFEEHNIILTPAEVDRVNGWQRLHDKFGNIMQGIQPTMFVHQGCHRLIEQIQSAQHSDKRQGDIEKMNADEEGNGGDDALDSCRYLVASDPSTSFKFAKPIGGFGYKALGFG